MNLWNKLLSVFSIRSKYEQLKLYTVLYFVWPDILMQQKNAHIMIVVRCVPMSDLYL